MGIFKRFRASMSFGINDVEETTVTSTQTAVYRPFSNDSVFSPGFRGLEEGTYNVQTPGPPKTNQPRVKNELPKVNLPKPQSTVQPSVTSNGQVPKNSQPVVTSEPGTSKNKTTSSSKDNKSKSDKKDKEKKKDKKGKDKEKVKVGEMKAVKSKTKKEKEKKDKKKEKEKKEKKVKNDSKQVASVTIDEAAVASAQEQPTTTQSNTLPAPPPYTVEDRTPRSRNALTNPLAGQKSITAEEHASANARFTSSWDQVAMHRENLHREIHAYKPQPNNLRNMMNQERQVSGNEATTQFRPHSNSPRNVMTRNTESNRLNRPIQSDGSGSDYDA